jgi:hypothetical protein
MSHTIGSLNEKPLHLALKQWYAEPGDRLEVEVEGFVVDIVRDDLLIEVQTRGFSGIKRKLQELVGLHPLRLVYPIAREKWILKLAGEGQGYPSRRKSPKRGRFEHVFAELVSFPRLIADESFSLEVLLIQEEEIRRREPGRAWRRGGWVTHERRLLKVTEQRLFETPGDLASLLPDGLPVRFTTSDLATVLAVPRRLAQQMAYCLRQMGSIAQVGKQGNAFLYARVGDAASKVETPV